MARLGRKDDVGDEWRCGDKRLWLLMPYYVLAYYLRGGKPLSREQARKT